MAVPSRPLRRLWRRTRPHHLAYAAAALLVVGGGAGSAAFYVELTRLAARAFPDLDLAFRALRLALVLVAALGGVAVFIGGRLAELRRPRFVCSLFLALGAGMGLAGLAVQVASIVREGTGFREFAAGWVSLAGLGTALALLAQVRLLQR